MQPTRRALLQSITAGAGALLAAPRRPNFVFVLVDDLRYNALSCTGHPFLKTPHIDRIAGEGVKFDNAFVTISLCSPSRGCFLTGQYAHTHGITDNTNRNAQTHQLVTFPKLLHDAGYNTGYVGKWHMGNDDSPRPGFDRWVSFKGQGVYENPPINIDGQPTQTQGYMTDILTSHAVDFIQQKRSAPFCLYLGHKAIHGPFSPPPRHRDLFAGLSVPRKPNAKDSLEGKPALRRQAQANTNDPVSKQVLRPGGPGDEVILNQLRCIPAIDDGVGRLYDALKQTGQLDDTVFVFTSDNGYLWGEHGLGDKRASYEESIRIPMLARYPRLIRAGSTASETVLNIDIAPTFLSLAGVPVPASMQGVPITPVLQRKARNWRQSFLIEYFEEKQFPRIPSYQAVRTATHKYTHYTGLEGMDEFYDLQADPGEMKNLINEPSAQKALKSAQAELARLLKETRA
jgi:N-acetylglucosamine-6-sulfatase